MENQVQQEPRIKRCFCGSRLYGQSFFAVYHVQRIDKHTAEVKGRERPGDIGVGDMILFPLGHEVALEIIEIEQRNHRGVFKEPEDAIGSFFKATCKRTDIPEEFKMKKKK